jgi:predicted NBD/HSP70 family sugar kinase
VGGGLLHAGRLITGPHGIAGEWGHNPMPLQWLPEAAHQQERACYCGQFNCIETFLCGAGLMTSHRQLGGDAASPGDLVARAHRGDAQSMQTLALYCRQLAAALATLINVIDPHTLVLGGGLSNIGLLYEQVPRYWQAFVFSDSVQTRLLPPRYGDSSGVRGAAWLWPLES